MRKSIIIILLGFITACSQSKKSSEKYSDAKGKFKIGFPSAPTANVQARTTAYGPTTMFSFVCNPKDDANLSYELRYLDFPPAASDTLETEETYSLFDAFLKSMIDSSKTELTNISNHQVQGYVGREYRWQNTESKVLSRERFFLVDNRLYILYVSTDANHNFNKDINLYFNSFELTDTKSNPKASTEKKEEQSSHYIISFPKNPERRETEALTEYGTAKLITHIAQPKLVDDKNVAYGVNELRYLQNIEATKSFDLKTYYDDVVNRLLTGTQSTLISRKSIKIGNKEAIEFKAAFRGGEIVIKQRTILRGDTQYSVQVMTIPDNDENEDMNRFLDSFSLKELNP